MFSSRVSPRCSAAIPRRSPTAGCAVSGTAATDVASPGRRPAARGLAATCALEARDRPKVRWRQIRRLVMVIAGAVDDPRTIGSPRVPIIHPHLSVDRLSTDVMTGGGTDGEPPARGQGVRHDGGEKSWVKSASAGLANWLPHEILVGRSRGSCPLRLPWCSINPESGKRFDRCFTRFRQSALGAGDCRECLLSSTKPPRQALPGSGAHRTIETCGRAIQRRRPRWRWPDRAGSRKL